MWSQQTKLLAADGAEIDSFGNSMSLAADTAVVGAPYDDDDGAESGSVYVFARSGGVWTPQAKLTASDGEPEDLFGFSVSVDGSTKCVSGTPPSRHEQV